MQKQFLKNKSAKLSVQPENNVNANGKLSKGQTFSVKMYSKEIHQMDKCQHSHSQSLITTLSKGAKASEQILKPYTLNQSRPFEKTSMQTKVPYSSKGAQQQPSRSVFYKIEKSSKQQCNKKDQQSESEEFLSGTDFKPDLNRNFWQRKSNHHSGSSFNINSQSKERNMQSEQSFCKTGDCKEILCPPSIDFQSETIQNNFDTSEIFVPNFSTFLTNPNCSHALSKNIASKNGPKISFLNQRQICICPELYFYYRTQSLLYELNQEVFSLRIYNKGRKQLKYKDGTIEVILQDKQIKLTYWENGDFKLVDGERVSFWSQENEQLDQYYIN